MKPYLLAILLLLPQITFSQEECYTEWENNFIKELNDYRKKLNLSPWQYSETMTKAAYEQSQDTKAYISLFNLYKYQGSGRVMLCRFSFDYETPKEALELMMMIELNKQYITDTYTTLYKSIGLVRVENEVIAYIGTKEEIEMDIPLCQENNESVKNYEWILLPQSEFWEMAPIHIGKYIPVRNINRWGVCNEKGEMVIPYNYWFMSPYKTEGQFIVTKEHDDKKSMIIDINENIVEEFKLDGYIMLKENRIAYEGNYNYVINKNGDRLSEKYQDIFVLNKNYLAYQNKGLYGIMDHNGKIIVQPKYVDMLQFSDGYCAVRVGSKWGFIDSTLEMVISPMAIEKEDMYFSNDRVKIKMNGKYGFMNPKGEIIVKPEYEFAMQFGDNGLAPVMKNGKYGYINLDGKIIIPLENNYAKSFSYNYGALKKDSEKYAILDNKGNIITGYDFDEVVPQENGTIKVRNDGRWGIIKIKN